MGAFPVDLLALLTDEKFVVELNGSRFQSL
jgi:hypothetical protein